MNYKNQKSSNRLVLIEPEMVNDEGPFAVCKT